MNKLCITKLYVTRRKAIALNLFCIINNRVVYFEPVTVTTNHILCFGVHFSHRCVIFDFMHASSIPGHMGESKTLYRLKLRFF